MGMATGGGDGFLADINVTPFVDVMLVLLIIFMVTAPMMTQGLEVDLPQTKTVTTLPQNSENMVLTIKKDGSLHLAEYDVTMDDLPGQVQRLVTDQKKMLFLRADREVPYGVVVQVMGVLKGAGVDKIGMVAEPEPAKDDNSKGRARK
jgi:biopolymer transport protein TolR